MEKTIENFVQQFMKIKSLKWVKSKYNGCGSIGRTFEDFLNIPQNNFEIPDYSGIEIKTKMSNYRPYLTLFSAVPDGPHYHEINRIRELYGYPDSTIKNCNILNNCCYSSKLNLIGRRYYFKIKICKPSKKIYLLIFDKNLNLIENNVYWDFDTIETKLKRKLNILAFVEAKRKFINNIEYFYYYKLTLYKLKNFETFIELLETEKIRITFKIGVYKNGPKKGKIYDHGTGFEIKKEDLLKLYDLINIYY